MARSVPCLIGVLASSWAPSLAAAENVRDFPNYDDPITARAPLPHPPGAQTPCATTLAIDNAALSSFGQVVTAHMDPPPASCSGPWAQVVVEVTGRVAGTQFDRYGALWFRGVELLRTTTPEPSPEGITWTIEKDITDYGSLFLEGGDVTLQIPNIVDSTYTGVLYIDVKFSYYGKSGGTPNVVMPLIDASQQSNPLNTITNSGYEGQAHSISLPANTIRARLDLFASGHGCEEFWYANELNGANCGGGAFREIRILVDGDVVGAQYPFPVMYTGGVNPLLWRPLTGILSFEIPAYHFDLSPVLSRLGPVDGQEHNLTIQVVGNTDSGFWLLDGVLLLEQSPDDTVSSGSVAFPPTAAANTKESIDGSEDTKQVQRMTGCDEFHVVGELKMASGGVISSEVYGKLNAWSKNIFEDEGGEQDTYGKWYSKISSVRDGWRATVVYDYPYQLLSAYAQNADSFQLTASIDFTRNVAFSFDHRAATDPVDHAASQVQIYNRMQNSAVYNRSTDAERRMNKQEGTGRNRFYVSASDVVDSRRLRSAPTGVGCGPVCYKRELTAEDGSVVKDDELNACDWATGPYVCGQDLCSAFRGMTLTPPTRKAAHEQRHVFHRTAPSPGAKAGVLPARFGRWSPQPQLVTHALALRKLEAMPSQPEDALVV